VSTEQEAGGPDLRATGERIEALLDASAAGGIVARERAEELVRLVIDLYGAGIERILDLLHEQGRLDDVALDALAGDDLVASLLLVHGLHPDDVTTRIERAIDGVRPVLARGGADLELLGVDDGPTVRVRVTAGGGCGSSSAPVHTLVEQVIMDNAPEVRAVDVQEEPPEVVIPVSSLRVRPGLSA
jgi:Fe-S cluster biogenesis protein NfuA